MPGPNRQERRDCNIRLRTATAHNLWSGATVSHTIVIGQVGDGSTLEENNELLAS